VEQTDFLSDSSPKAGRGLPRMTFELAGAWRTPWLRNISTFAVGLAIVALLFRKLELRTTTELLKRASLSLLALSAAALCAFHILRAVRWAIILRGKVSFLALFMYSSVGVLISLITAAQAGEFVKPALVRARHGVPYFVTAASVAVERLLDVTVLVLMGLIAVIALPGRALGPAWFTTGLKIGGLLCAMSFLILALGSRWAGGVLGMASKALALVHLPARISERIVEIVRTFLNGTSAALSPLYLCSAILCSVVLWAFNAASVAIVFQAVNRPVASIPVVLLGFAALSFGAVIPLTPGCVGQYEAVWLVVFGALHVGPEGTVLAAGLLSHVLILLTIAFFGLLGLGFLHLCGSSEDSLREWRQSERG